MATVGFGAAVVAWIAAQPIAAHAEIGLTDPSGSGPIVSAVQRLQGTLLGTVAAVLAVIAVASLGLLMLTGRINWRYGTVGILSCFILRHLVELFRGDRRPYAENLWSRLRPW